MILEGEVSIAKRLDFNDLHSDVESVDPDFVAQECTTPQKSFSIPFCGSSYTPDCDETMKPKIGMTFANVESAKEFYKGYAHHVGFSVRVGQHKVIDGVTLYKRFFCAKEGFRTEKNVQSSCEQKRRSPTESPDSTKPYIITSFPTCQELVSDGLTQPANVSSSLRWLNRWQPSSNQLHEDDAKRENSFVSYSLTQKNSGAMCLVHTCQPKICNL